MDASAQEHGRTAKHPRDIPWRGWWDISVRVWDSLSRDNATLMAAGLAMYALLALFPALTATISIYGLFVTPSAVVHQISGFAGQMPPGVWDLLKTQLQDVASKQHGTLSAAAAIGLAVALWSASSGMSSLMTATNIAYGEREQRGFLLQTAIALLMTVGALVGFILMLALAFAVPVILGMLGTNPVLQIIGELARWLLLWWFAVLALAIVYRLAPAREPPRWHWVTWGSGIAATLWLVGTVLFTLYVRLFASYQKTYGALSGVVVLLMWFYLSSFLVVLGAEINAESERQTVKDTTTGEPKPMGRRGAYAADTVGPTAEQAQQQKKHAHAH
jgi:membrane protein